MAPRESPSVGASQRVGRLRGCGPQHSLTAGRARRLPRRHRLARTDRYGRIARYRSALATATLLPFLVAMSASDTVLDDVVVTPGRGAGLRERATTRHSVTRDDLRGFPHLGEDVFRAVARVPGIATDEYAAQFSIRGGEEDEVLVLLDGMELYEPFHLKDVNGGALSVIDVGDIDILTGAFPARFGDRLSGVLDMTSATPSRDGGRTSLGLSMTNARLLSEGRLRDGRGHWLFVARRGYLDLVLDITDASPQVDLRPVYYDAYGKVALQAGENHTLSAHALWAADTMTIADDEDTVDNSYGNGYGWLTWEADVGRDARQRTVLSAGRVTRHRLGTDLSGSGGRLNSEVSEERAFDLLGLKQAWMFAPSQAHLVSAGFDIKRHSAAYAYASSTRRQSGPGDEYVTRASDIDIAGTQVGAYVGDKIAIGATMTADIGVRYDSASWLGESVVGPRVGVARQFGGQTAARVGWGRFSQFQRIADLRVQDGEEAFRRPERAEHRVLGVEHMFDGGMNLQVDVYQKALSGISPRYLNLDGDVDFYPEIEGDRARVEPKDGSAKGIEAVLTRDVGDALSWWLSYAYAFAEDDIDGVTTPRDFDQRHAFSVDISYRASYRWRWNVAWQYRTGRPYTPRVFERLLTSSGRGRLQESVGAVNSARLPPYHRLDVRLHRYFGGAGSQLAVYAEVRNVYNRGNVRRYEVDGYIDRDGEIVVLRTPVTWLPILPSVGLRWDF